MTISKVKFIIDSIVNRETEATCSFSSKIFTSFAIINNSSAPCARVELLTFSSEVWSHNNVLQYYASRELPLNFLKNFCTHTLL